MKVFEPEFARLFRAHQQMLREQLNIFLNTLHPLIRADVVRSLEIPGKLLSHGEVTHPSSPIGMWSLLPLLIAQYIANDIDRQCANRVAIAIECFVCALDLLDDIEDGDQTLIVQELGSARVLNISTTLLALTNHILLSLIKVGFSSEHVARLLDTVQKSLIVATAGQHRDILAEQRLAESFTTEECVEIAEGKAGSLMSVACRVGALCANANAQVVEQFSELGKLLGIAHQLDNDSHDLYHILQYQQTGESQGTIKTDLVRQKKTLPVVLAAHTLMALQHAPSTTDEEKERMFNNVLHEGIITTWGISLLYRERAHDILRQIEVRQPISHELRLLLNFA